jgi:hypothetical protein
MSAHATAALNALPPVTSPPSLPVTGGLERDPEPVSSAATLTGTSPLEPHWEPVISAATD